MHIVIRRITTSLLLLSAATAQAGGVPTGCVNLAGGAITPNVQWPEVWQALNTQAGCAQNCHNGSAPAGNLDLSSVRFSQLFMVEQLSSQSATVELVDSGAPEKSLFFNKLNCTSPGVGNRMPPGGNLPLSLQALVYDWIEQGAYGENIEDPITRDFIFRGDMESIRRPRRPN
jgi:hypothetical protein